MPTQPPTLIEVDYAEAEDSPTGGVDDKGDYETRVYYVAWADKLAFLKQLKGTAKISGGPGGRWVTTVPFQSPDNPRLYVADIKWAPDGTPQVPSAPARHSHVKVTVQFRPPVFDYGPADPLNSLTQDSAENDLLQLCSQEIDYTRDHYSIPGFGSKLKFLSDGRPIKKNKTNSVSIQHMVLTYHRFPVLPVGYLRLYQDCVNDATFLGCPRGTVMLDLVRTSREAVVGGDVSQRLVMAYKYRQVDWNKEARDDTGAWDYVVPTTYTTGGATTGSAGSAFSNAVTYPYRDFRKLLWVDFLGTTGG